MASTAVYGAQVSAGEYPRANVYGDASPPLSPASATLVNAPIAPRIHERPSVKLNMPHGKSDIVNSSVVDVSSGQTLYSISSNSKRTTLVSCKNGVEIATVEWDRSSPRMVFRRKKTRCKDWLPLAGPETESRVLTHDGSVFTWMHKDTSGYLIPANRPGLAVARWRIKSRTDNLSLEVFQEALVEPGLLDAIILSVVLLRSGRRLGDTLEAIGFANPRFYSLPQLHMIR